MSTLHSIEYLYIHYFGSKPDTTIDDLRGLTKLKVLDIVVKDNVTNSTFHPLAGLPTQELRFTWVLSCKTCYMDKTTFDPFTSVTKLLTDFRALHALGSLRSPLQTLHLVSWLKGYPSVLKYTTLQVLSKMNESLIYLAMFLPLRHIENGAFIWIPNLITVVVKYSQLQTLDKHAFQGLNALQDLFLGNNRLTAVPSDTLGVIAQFTSLQSLDLSSNSISTVEDDAFSAASSITYLNMENNKMQDDYNMPLRWLDLLRNLQRLTLGRFGSFYSNNIEIDLPLPLLSLQNFKLRNVQSVKFKTNFCSVFPNVTTVIISDAVINDFPNSLGLHACCFFKKP